MSLGRFGAVAAAAALACAGPVRADYAAGKAAWDAGRPAAALAEWRAAADGGDRRAMLALGRLYAKGLGAPQDFVLAHMWFNLAASRGEAAALKERDALAARMTPAALAEAQKRARDWRPGPGAVFRDCPECPEMVVVPAGSFMMGSPSSEKGREWDEGPPCVGWRSRNRSRSGSTRSRGVSSRVSCPRRGTIRGVRAGPGKAGNGSRVRIGVGGLRVIRRRIGIRRYA